MGKRKAAERPIGESIGEDSTPLEERVRNARRRRMLSSEYRWLHLDQTRQTLRVAPPGRTPDAPRMDPATRDTIRDLPARLDARAAIVATSTFKPTDYLGVSDTAKSSGDQGWIAWETLPYLEWLAEYVARSKAELSSAVNARIVSARVEAEQFLRNRLAARTSASPEERSVLEARITDLFRPTRSPGTDQRGVADSDRYDNRHSIKYIETRERDREFINAGLEIPSAWNPLPPPPDLAKSIVSQLQARGANSATILSALSEFGLANSDEAAAIRQQAAEERSRAHRYVRVRAHEIPPSVIETAFFTVANYFDAVRREWKASDEKLTALMAAGCGPETGGFESIGRDLHRSDLRWHLHKLEHDTDFIPSILPYCDPSLRDDIVRMLKLLDLDSYQNNRYGEESARWRQQWEAMDLDRDLDGLIMKLRAAGDRQAMRRDGAAARKEGVAGKKHLPTPPEEHAPVEFAHSDDFTSIVWCGHPFQLSKGQQALAMQLLWSAWEAGGRKDGFGLSEGTIGEKVGSSNSRFRLAHVFKKRSDLWGRVIRPSVKGAFALYRIEPFTE